MPGFSNCSFRCIDPTPAHASAEDTGLPESTYTGIQWQCVEYARRWWLLRRGIVFDSVDTADDMWQQVRSARRLTDAGQVLVEPYENGGRNPPEEGDLLIYAADPNVEKLRFGHVAVVVDVDVEGQTIGVAEQNFDNRPWQDPEALSRRIPVTSTGHPMTSAGAAYTIGDESGAQIYGWLRPRSP